MELLFIIGILILVGVVLYLQRKQNEENKRQKEELQEQVEQLKQSVDVTMELKMAQGFYQNQSTINQAMQQVSHSMGNMQKIASGVEHLEDVLANVKTRGILGEIQLFQCIEDILPARYIRKNTPVIPKGREVVECAIVLEQEVLLPIDSKFPLQPFLDLQNATNENEAKIAKNALVSAMKNSAKDIQKKYIVTPYTTSFAILFVPIETLYLECLSLGLLEVLRSEYQIILAGPSTLNAIVSALLFGFQTLEVENKAQEIFHVLESIQQEFQNYKDSVEQIQFRLQQTQKELDQLQGVRMRRLEKALQQIETLQEMEKQYD